MARRRVVTTKYEIIQVASEFFMSVGYSNTSPKMIAEELGLSTGNITYYFPTKEHLLAVVVEMLCDFQWRMLEAEALHVTKARLQEISLLLLSRANCAVTSCVKTT